MSESELQTSESNRLASRPSLPTKAVLFLTWTPAAWLIFLWTHELGHIVAGLITGGKIDRVVLHPLAFSRTDVSPNPSPLLVAWSGVALGPLIATIALLFLLISHKGSALYKSILGFVILANGCYIGLGVAMPVGDTADILRLGTQEWVLIAFALPLCITGIWIWGGINPVRCFAQYSQQDAHKAATVLLTIVLILSVIGGVLFG